MQGQYNGLVPGADGAPVRLPAQFYWREKEVLGSVPKQFKKVAFTRIFLHGGDTADRPTTEADKENYPRQWAAFEAGQEQAKAGWLIEHCPFLDVAQVATYKALNIFTVESLATAPDTSLQNIMGAMDHRKQAQALLKSANDSKPLLELTQQNKELGETVDMLKSQLADVCAEFQKFKDKDKKNKEKE